MEEGFECWNEDGFGIAMMMAHNVDKVMVYMEVMYIMCNQPISRSAGRFLQENIGKAYRKWKQCSNRKVFEFFLTNSDHLLAYSDDFSTNSGRFLMKYDLVTSTIGT